MKCRAQVSFLLSLCLVPTIGNAHDGEGFSDLPETHPAFTAVAYLHSQGVIHGYDDGTFQAEKKVNRAEAVKLIVAPRVTPEELAAFTETPFTDIPAGSWYLPYTEAARQTLGFIDGPPKRGKFEGERPVQHVEFLKMLVIANTVDPFAFNEIQLPLASDVRSVDEWYYPYLRFALSSSMTVASTEGLLSPGEELTRGDVALILYRFLMYQEDRRTQALLSICERELLSTLAHLEGNDIGEAEYSSARALLAARGAHASRPTDPVTQGALKITESFRSLVRAYRAGLNEEFEQVIALTGDAWNFAEQARTMSSEMDAIARKVQESAHGMAESARRLLP
jgi:hypothetical protein